jgi:hypothetical protein
MRAAIEQGAIFRWRPPEPILDVASYRVARATPRNAIEYDVAPDGQRFLFVKPIQPLFTGGHSELIFVQGWLDELDRRSQR